MASPTPSGPLMQPLASLRTWLSGLSACQTILGADDAAEAVARIHWPELSFVGMTAAAKLALRPTIILAIGDGGGARRSAFPNTWGDSLTVAMGLWILPSETYESRADQYVAFGNAVGSLEDAMRAASGIGGPNIVEIRRTTGPRRPGAKAVAEGVIDEYTIEYELTLETGE